MPQSQAIGAATPSRHEALVEVVAATPADRTIVLASTGFCGRELYAIDDRPNQLYMVGSMGCVSSFALGFALARPDLDVVALDGDGAALMRLGAFATIGRYGPPNLTHVLLDNGVHESTGGQATVASSVSFAAIAAACGYASAVDSDHASSLRHLLVSPPADGPRFLRLAIGSGTPADLPRPTITPVEVTNATDAPHRSQPRTLMLLLNPGPVTLTERVRRSLLQPDLCHRESEFFDLQDEARTRLLDVYGLDRDVWAAVLITGSGTAAVESMIASLVPSRRASPGRRERRLRRSHRADRRALRHRARRLEARLDARTRPVRGRGRARR